MEENQTKTEYAEDEINLLDNLMDYLIVLLKRKKFIISVTLGIMVITAIYSLIIPPAYRAETKILSPQQSGQGSMSQLLGQLGGAAGGMVNVSSAIMKTPGELYIGMLKTNNVLDRIIDRFDLIKLYKAKSRVQVRASLSGALTAKEDKKSGIISISVEDRDPKRAAQFANAFVEELKALNRGFALTESSQRRLFYEEQLQDTKNVLFKVEEDMKAFQEKTGVLQMESQVMSSIMNMASAKAAIAGKEVELRVLKTYSTSNNPDVKRVEEAINGLKAELNNLQAKSKIEYDPLMPSRTAPQVGLEYLRKFRDVKFNQILYEFFLKQYEAAKIDEARDAIIIQTLDKAEPPEWRFKPKRTQMVLIAGVIGFFLSIFAVFIMDYSEKLSSNPENKERIDEMKRHFSFNALRKIKGMKTNIN